MHMTSSGMSSQRQQHYRAIDHSYPIVGQGKKQSSEKEQGDPGSWPDIILQQA